MSADPSEYFNSLPKRRVGAGALLDVAGNVLGLPLKIAASPTWKQLRVVR